MVHVYSPEGRAAGTFTVTCFAPPATIIWEATVTPATAAPPPTGLNKVTSQVLTAKFGSDPLEVVAVTAGGGRGEGDRTLKFILIHMAGVIRVGVALIPGEFS